MKRRSFLALLGLAPVAATAAPKPERYDGLRWMDGSPATIEEFDASFASVPDRQIVVMNNSVAVMTEDGIEWFDGYELPGITGAKIGGPGRSKPMCNG